MPADPWLVAGALAVEAATGYPPRLHARVPHPVAWIAGAVRWFEDRLNFGGPARRRIGGIATLLAVAGGAGLTGWAWERAVSGTGWGVIVLAALGSLGLATRNLYDHVAAVSRALEAGDLAAARTAVGRIVGRDVDGLDAGGVATAGLESLAESFCDGVVAPLFWFLLGGLGGLFAYKAINTADSLIGHREAPYTQFGWAAARTDDLANLLPARLSGVLIALVGGGWRTMWRDADRHASPNGGWPEAAMAGALGVRLGGPVRYDGVAHDRATLGAGEAPTAADLRRGLRIYLWACGLTLAALVVGGLAWPR